MKAVPEKDPSSARPSSAHPDVSRTTTAPERPPGDRPAPNPRSLQRLQRAAGNAAVSRLVAQRYTAPVKPSPAQAPGFRKVKADVAAKRVRLAAHAPAATESKSAQDAAVAPPDDKEAQGKAANAEKMNAAKPGEFDKQAFIDAVNKAIDAQAPKNLDDADKFSKSGKADKIKDEVDGKVSDGKESSAKDIDTATKAPPDTSAAKDKPVTPLTPDQPPGNPGAPSATDAIPEKQPAAVTDFSEGPAANDQAMADAEVTEDQLAKGNEPEFDEALSTKKTAEADSAKAPAKGKAAEDQQLNTAKAGAAASGAQAINALTATRASAGKQVDGGKGETKSKDEKKRAEVTAKLQKVYDGTKKDVETALSDLDKKIDTAFTQGEKAARDAFTADHKRRMKKYKDKRYSGMFGPAKWAKDKLMGMPKEANDLFQEARKLYVAKMQTVISSVADIIGTELGKAKARIAKGRTELKAEVDKLPADLREFGQEAAQDFAGKFDDLEATVNEKSEQLVQDLATKYTAALNKVDEEIKKLQEANKGLVQKAKDAIVGALKTINELKNLLLGILAKAASAIMKIIKDPIGFLGNLVKAVGAGLNLFITNIATHLKTGVVSWLLGTAVKAGLELPQKFDLKGIIQLIGSLLGLTWDNIRARITRKGIPDQAVTAVESSVPVAKKLATEGPAGAVKEIEAEAGDLKATILEKLTSYLIPTVIIAGITWIISLLNPASAFVRAVKGIIDIVTFIVNQGAQIVEFVNAVLDSVIAIANGGSAGVPKMVETALAASVPLLIGFLASLLGIGSLANKVKSVFHAVARPVNRAIDKIVGFIARKGKALWQKLRDDRGGKSTSNDPRTGRPGAKSDERKKQEQLDQAVRAIKPRLAKALNAGISPKQMKIKLAYWKARYRLSSLTMGTGGDFTATVNPSIVLNDPKGKKVTDAELADLLLPIFHEVEEMFSRQPSATLTPAGFQYRLPFAEAQGEAFERGEDNALHGLTRSEQRAILASVRQGSSSQQVEPGVVLWSNRQAWQGWSANPSGVRRIPKVQGPWVPGLSREERGRREPGAYRPGMMSELIDRGVQEFGLDRTGIENSLTTGSSAAVAALRRRMTSGSEEEREKYLKLLDMHNLLRHAVEAGRYPGMGTTTAMSSALVATGIADHDRVIVGDLAPMAPKGAAFTGKKPKRRRDPQGNLVPLGSRYPHENELAERIRYRRVGAIVRELLQAASSRAIIVTPSGYKLHKLSEAIRHWLAMRLGHDRDPEDIIQSAARLRSELMHLMAHYDGQT